MVRHFLKGFLYPYKKYGILKTLTGYGLLHCSIKDMKREYIKEMKA